MTRRRQRVADTSDQTRELAQKACRVSLSFRGTKESPFNSIPKPQPCEEEIPFEPSTPVLLPYSNLSYVNLCEARNEKCLQQCLLAELVRHLSVICLSSKRNHCQDHFAVLTTISSTF